MLAKVTTTTSLGLDVNDLGEVRCNPQGYISTFVLVQEGYFATFADCQKMANFEVSAVNITRSSNSGHNEMDVLTSTGTGGIVTLPLSRITVPVANLGPGAPTCSLTTAESFTTFIKTKVPNINELICKPWENNPPFECTTFETLSFFSILSQSFAITSGIFTILTITMKYVLETSWWYESNEDAATAMLTKEDVDSDTGAGPAMLTKEKADNDAGTGTAVVAKEKEDTWVDNPGNAL